MDVAAYIKQLLYSKQLVYVPGLGTFSTLKTAGTYNSQQQLFYPPKNSIAFVAEEKEDKTLENYISLQKNISSQAARYFIDKFTDQVKYEASTQNLPVNEVVFPPEIDKNKEAELANTNLNQENFGLPPINLITLKSGPEAEAISKKDYVENFYREFSKNLADENVENQPKKKNTLWLAAVALLVVCLIGIYALYVFHPDLFNRFRSQQVTPTVVVQKPVTDSVNQVPVVEKQMEKDTVKTVSVDKPIAAETTVTAKPNIETAPKQVEKSVATTVKQPVSATTNVSTDPDLIEKSPYEIIGASFKTLKGAKAFLSQLKSKGMHRAKILNNTAGKQMLITFGSFQDKETAQAALEKLRAKDVHSEAYIQHYVK